ncbi:gastrula zinc finger protein XlCGF49.1-like [Acipenser ruthenus]|uniref:gastrula zinc finger protein XlCGF49.1-like n=1 Tax=Acipenser ruthenus TaxID=7906 RepID=UPI0027427C95|nr:gastrula zinc finger protein XlCGF49.1-like [Acipenser ruthenus]XP_058872901.1 gastrula zinc finger protein XlCGF49.1-like [Acipenser ruthenus]
MQAVNIKQEVLEPVHIKEEPADLEPVQFAKDISELGLIHIKEETPEAVLSNSMGPNTEEETEMGPTPFKHPIQIHPSLQSRNGSTVNPVSDNHSQTAGNFHQCAECGKCFSLLKSLKRHLRTHTDVKPYRCIECGKNFKKINDLKKHLGSHTGAKPHSCTECGKSFRDFYNLKIHQRIHTGEKPLRCPDCGKSFRHLNSFKIHQRVHTGEKPFHCTECGKNFNLLGNLKKHQRVHK